jgi:hypothetical protein
VTKRDVASLISLLRQGLTLGVQFGTQSVEALLWVAQTIEEGVYVAHSLTRSSTGITFALDNPPLRVGAFTALTVLVEGAPVPGDRVRLRRGEGSPWRTAASIGPSVPFDLAPGDPTEFDLVGTFGRPGAKLTVRLELHNPAVPPRVWLEFTETPSAAVATP